jgi:hypothetical protein
MSVSYITESLACVSLKLSSNKEYHVRDSGFRERGEEQDRTSIHKEGCEANEKVFWEFYGINALKSMH